MMKTKRFGCIEITNRRSVERLKHKATLSVTSSTVDKCSIVSITCSHPDFCTSRQETFTRN